MIRSDGLGKVQDAAKTYLALEKLESRVGTEIGRP